MSLSAWKARLMSRLEAVRPVKGLKKAVRHRRAAIDPVAARFDEAPEVEIDVAEESRREILASDELAASGNVFELSELDRRLAARSR